MQELMDLDELGKQLGLEAITEEAEQIQEEETEDQIECQAEEQQESSVDQNDISTEENEIVSVMDAASLLPEQVVADVIPLVQVKSSEPNFEAAEIDVEELLMAEEVV